MTPINILRTTKSLESASARQVLWYLHSRYIEDEGFEKVSADLMACFGGKLSDIMDYGFDHRKFNQYDLAENLKQFCNYGNGASLPVKFLGVLHEFTKALNLKIRDKFHLTNVGSKVWETLDWCLEERRPCFIEGHTGRGKSTATRAWYEAHRGDSRYVSLSGLRTQRAFFEAIATAYGVNFSTAKAPNEIRFRLHDVIVRSGLILILDEAHHALPERQRDNRPVLIDWIDCDLCNAGVPVVLVSTPQFGPCLAEFAKRTNWNVQQFIRRFSGRWKVLDEKTTETDLAALAQQAMPKLGTKGVEFAVACAQTIGRDVSGLFDLVHDAERRARKAGRTDVTKQDLLEAFDLDRVPTENAMAHSFKRPLYSRPSAVEDTLPDVGEPAAAPLQHRRATESEFTAPDRGKSTPLLVTH